MGIKADTRRYQIDPSHQLPPNVPPSYFESESSYQSQPGPKQSRMYRDEVNPELQYSWIRQDDAYHQDSTLNRNQGYQQYPPAVQNPQYSSKHQRYDSWNPPQQSINSGGRFRPLAVPQITFGDGQPFPRVYSQELEVRGILQETMFAVINDLNAAIIPNPEAQIFQKAAGIASFFVPGAYHLGLIGGRIVVGLGTAFGHASMINRALARANLEVFNPAGLELCLAQTKDVDQAVGAWPTQNTQILTPQQRIANYGDALGPWSVLLPPLGDPGRTDPLAHMGKSMGDKKARKKLEHAQKDLAEGKMKDLNKLEKGLKWILIKEAKSESSAQWQQVLGESEAALQEEQRAASHQSRQ